MFLLFVFQGCDSAARCALNGYQMTIYTDRLPVAAKGEYYRAVITSGIDRNPNDDLYDYEYSYDGYLPDGLYITENDRELVISGIPSESGTFSLDVTVMSRRLRDEAYDDEYYSGFTCIDYNDSASFALIVMGDE
jgi:hypothetical protein